MKELGIESETLPKVVWIARAIPNAPESLPVLGWREATTVWTVAEIDITTSDNAGMPAALIEALAKLMDNQSLQNIFSTHGTIQPHINLYNQLLSARR